MAARPSFFAELKRRNVLRAAVLYIGAVWALAQGISQLSPAFNLQTDVTRWFVIACVIGFPFWIAFAWFYEFTPQGIKRESEVAPEQSITHSTARKLDFAIIGVMAVAIVLLTSGYFIRHNTPITMVKTTPSASTPFSPPKGSLVVLPFKNLNGDPKQQYFSDGITEELTDALGQNPALRVIAWDTASRLRDGTHSAGDIGKRLNVANLLHGSVEREGDQVRIMAELVDTRTGLQLWSQRYDEALAGIFKVQDQVSEAIAGALKLKFAQSDLSPGGTNNPRAHELVLRGRALLNKFDPASLAAAQDDFERAIALDQNYADAHVLLADALMARTERADLPLKSVLPRMRAEADTALHLDPRNVGVWVALGMADAGADPPNAAKARAEFRKALMLDPSNAAAHNDYANLLPLKAALSEVQEATWLSPRDEAAWNNLIVDAQDLGDWAEVLRASETLLKMDPAILDSAFSLAYANLQLGRHERAIAAFDLAKPSTPLDREQIAAGRLTYRSIVDPSLRPQAVAALNELSRNQSNQDVAGNLLQLYLTLGETGAALRLLETSCHADPIGCSDLAVNPMYAALRGDARFGALAKKYTTVAAQ